MKKSLKVVSFYTSDTPYEKEAKDLIESCKKFDLDYDVSSLPSLGSWSANCCMKPRFLLSKLEEHNCPLLWTDCDSIFNKEPEMLYNCRSDMALRINDSLPNDNKAKILTGTIFVNNTSSTKKLLELWEKKCHLALKKESIVFDQVCLRKVAYHYPTIVEIKHLPISYLYIIDNPHDRAEIHGDAVIIHYQASRIYQKILDGELSSSLIEEFSSQELKKMRSE